MTEEATLRGLHRRMCETDEFARRCRCNRTVRNKKLYGDADSCVPPAGSACQMNEEASQHRPPQTIADTLAEPEFWYGNFQSW
jgi:hypothetical protein